MLKGSGSLTFNEFDDEPGVPAKEANRACDDDGVEPDDDWFDICDCLAVKAALTEAAGELLCVV